MTIAIITPTKLTALTYVRVGPESSVNMSKEQAVILPPGADVRDVLMRVTEHLMSKMGSVTQITIACNGYQGDILDQ